jgi:hypothetical protein
MALVRNIHVMTEKPMAAPGGKRETWPKWPVNLRLSSN